MGQVEPGSQDPAARADPQETRLLFPRTLVPIGRWLILLPCPWGKFFVNYKAQLMEASLTILQVKCARETISPNHMLLGDDGIQHFTEVA